jgi:hypothetical protein
MQGCSDDRFERVHEIVILGIHDDDDDDDDDYCMMTTV